MQRGAGGGAAAAATLAAARTARQSAARHRHECCSSCARTTPPQPHAGMCLSHVTFADATGAGGPPSCELATGYFRWILSPDDQK